MGGLGAILGCFGAVLGRSYGVWGCSWAVLGRCWPGLSWSGSGLGRLGALWIGLWAPVCDLGCSRAALGLLLGLTRRLLGRSLGFLVRSGWGLGPRLGGSWVF